MAQVPAVPKSRRAWHLFRTKSLGLTSATPNMAASESAALRLRQAQPDQKTAQQVTFLIPVVGPAHVTDWSAVMARLDATLQSFLRQSNPNWQAILCCQEHPDLPADARITYLPFTDPTPGNDKWRKLRVLNQALPDMAKVPGYVMSFDADDLLHPNAVDEMLKRQKTGGYLVEAGLVMDVAADDIALSDTRSLQSPLRKPFWKLCGSCAALYYDPAAPEFTDFLTKMTQHEHRMFPYLADLAGRKLTPLTQPAVLYLLNHGENFGARRGRVGYKTRFVQKYKITDKARLKTIRAEFGLAP